jgi:hypothetical protein
VRWALVVATVSRTKTGGPAADNGLLPPELAAGITRVKGVRAKGVRVGNWLSVRQAQTLLNAPGHYDEGRVYGIGQSSVPIPMMSISHSDLMPIRTERSTQGSLGVK